MLVQPLFTWLSFPIDYGFVFIVQEKESASEDRGEDKATAPADVDKKIEKEEPKKEVDPLHEKWKAKMEDTLRELRSTLKGKLVQLGIDPEGDLTVNLFWTSYGFDYSGTSI